MWIGAWDIQIQPYLYPKLKTNKLPNIKSQEIILL